MFMIWILLKKKKPSLGLILEERNGSLVLGIDEILSECLLLEGA